MQNPISNTGLVLEIKRSSQVSAITKVDYQSGNIADAEDPPQGFILAFLFLHFFVSVQFCSVLQ